MEKVSISQVSISGKYIKFNKILVFENIRKILQATSCLIIFS